MLVNVFKNPYDYYVMADGELVGMPQRAAEVKAFLNNAGASEADVKRFDTHEFKDGKTFDCSCESLPEAHKRWI